MSTQTPRPRTPGDELTAFQRDLLVTIAGVGPCTGQAVRDAIAEEPGYAEEALSPGRLYPNLDVLVDAGLVEKGQYNRRSNRYELTDRGRAALSAYRRWIDERVGGETA